MAAAATIALTALGAGCHTIEPISPIAPPLAKSDERVVFGGVLPTYEPCYALKRLQRPPIAREALSARIERLLRDRGVFAGFDAIAPVAPPDCEIIVGAPAWNAAALALREKDERALAKATGAHRILEIDVVDARVAYVEQTAIMWLKLPLLIGWEAFTFPGVPDVPNFFIDSDRFELVLSATCRWLDEKGTTLATAKVKGRSEGVFGDFSRDWYYFGWLRVPGCLDDDSWLEIFEELRPSANEALARACVEAVESFAGTPGPEKPAKPQPIDARR